MIRTPLLNLLYKKANKALKQTNKKKPKQQKIQPQAPEISIRRRCEAAQRL